jgi:hypothetical protein
VPSSVSINQNNSSKEIPFHNGISVPKQQEVIELSSDDSAPRSVAKAFISTVGVAVATRPSASASLDGKLQQAPIDQYSSDDDSEKDEFIGNISSRLLQQQNTPLPAHAADAMKRARLAQCRLTQAQHYHAHDIYVPVKEPELIHRRIPRNEVRLGLAEQRLSDDMIKVSTLDLGVPLKLTCRTQMKIGEETKKRTHEVKLTIRDREPLQTLFDKLIQELALPPHATVSMSFDGMKLEGLRTPKSYDMEDGDLIDCTANATHLLATKGTTTPIIPTPLNPKNVVFGKRMKFTCRAQIKVTGTTRPKKALASLTSSLELREHEALSVLREQMIKAHNIPSTAKVTMSFDGEVCDPEQTPAKYDMESDDMIDFTVQVAQLWFHPS